MEGGALNMNIIYVKKIGTTNDGNAVDVFNVIVLNIRSIHE